MTIRIDERARAAIAHRRQRGRDATISLYVTSVPTGRGIYQFVAEWALRADSGQLPVCRHEGDAAVLACARVARYADWHNLTISAWRLGPIERLRVVDDPRVLVEMLAWERTHPRAVAPSGV